MCSFQYLFPHSAQLAPRCNAKQTTVCGNIFHNLLILIHHPLLHDLPSQNHCEPVQYATALGTVVLRKKVGKRGSRGSQSELLVKETHESSCVVSVSLD